MGKIRPLSENLIGKIAAGEVVERPSAAIKELVENSLDAGATAITVEIREGGLNYIRVSDNGSGIDESDIRMAFERHATSKIAREQDLNAISTLGFRGEALASIAAVSKITMTTRTADRETGLKIKNEGGKITEIQETACPVGTVIVVNDLFFNVPVRKGFMKKPAQEASAIHELMTRLLLSRPEVSFRYINNGKTEFHSPGDGRIMTAMQTIYGSQAIQSMKKVDDHGNGLLIRGLVGIGELGRGNRNQELFFINQRVMYSSILNEAVERACRERVMIGKFPVCALYVTIPYESVDVNVHPNKLEVRFRDEDAVREAVFNAVFTALKEKDAFEHPQQMILKGNDEKQAEPKAQPYHPPVQKSNVDITVSSTLPPEGAVPAETVKPAPVFRDVRSSFNSVPAAPEQQSPVPSQEKIPAEPTPPESVSQPLNSEQINTILPQIKKPLKIYGALFNTFIMVEYEDQLLLVDQHAVHERLLFDKMMEEFAGKESGGQELLVPVIISVTKHEQRVLENNRDALESIGMTVESFGENDVAVRSIPNILGETETGAFIRDVITELENGRDPTFEKKRTALLQSACKHAVKGGEALDEDQLRHLIETMIKQKVTPTCPHGRPLVISITHRELDKKFKRIQN